MNERDQIYAKSSGTMDDFVFDERVAHVFTDMINRSVPGYALILEMLGVVAEKYAQPNTTCYDLGCSLGASTLAIRCRLDALSTQNHEHYAIVAVDSSPAMIERCQVNLSRVPSVIPSTIICQRLQDTPITRASLIVLNFTLQFLPVAERLPTLQRIAQGTMPGGALVLSEKVTSEHIQTNKLLSELHHGFKRARGYSSLEISRKRAALEKVLLPETVSCHLDRLTSAGFSHVDVWFQCFNFVSLVAIK